MLLKRYSVFSIFLLFLFSTLVSCTSDKDSSKKILRKFEPNKIKGFDPIYGQDSYSNRQIGLVYEPLLKYHYLKRPYELEPNTASALPEVSEDGLTYTFKLKKGIRFHDDEAFTESMGAGRELKASDYVYSWKRLADPKMLSPMWWLLENRIKGLDEWREKYSDKDKVNYEEEIAGLKAVDDYTFQVILKKPFPQFPYITAMNPTSAVPMEAVEKYGKEFLNHPVGTGPFVLKEFRRGSKIVFEKNPDYRKVYFPTEGEPGDEALIERNKGKTIPLVDEVEVNIITESQPRWLRFYRGDLDYVKVPKDNMQEAVSSDLALRPEVEEKGIELFTQQSLDLTYMAFNMQHPVFGHPAGEKGRKLRCAISMAWNREKANELFYHGLATPAQTLIPPGVGGAEDPQSGWDNPYSQLNLKRAKKYMKEAGYAGGKGLESLTYETLANTTSRQIAEFTQKQIGELGVQINLSMNTWPQLLDKLNKSKQELHAIAWIADYPDAENFLQLLYGPNARPGGSNKANYKNKEFDELFQKARVMPAGEKREKAYRKLARMAAKDCPWVLGFHRKILGLRWGWLKNFKPTDFEHYYPIYLDIDLEEKKKSSES